MKRHQRNRQTPADAGGTIIRLEGVAKTYATGRVEFPALRGVDLSIASVRWWRSSAPPER